MKEGKGTTVLVTGANAGIGRATAEALARRGCRIIMACRSGERGEEARREIAAETGNRDLELHLADLSSQEEVRRLAEEVREGHERLDVLVNNAGVYSRTRLVTDEGLELQFAVNHLAPFLLTSLLLPLLRESAPARVVTVSSEAHRGARIRFEDLQLTRGYSGMKAYGQSKLANILFTRELAGRERESGVAANALHPGVVATKLLFEAMGALRLAKPFLRSPEEGARTPVYLALSGDVEGVTGEYFVDREPRAPSREARDSETARRLWKVSAELAGLT